MSSSYKCYSKFRNNRKIVLETNNYKCQICGSEAEEIHHIDGSKDNHSIDNLQCLCSKCHSKITQDDNKDKNKLNIIKIEVMLQEKNMTKALLAKKINISNAAIYHLFSRGSTYRRNVIKIAKVLECDIEEILLK